jgi:hypothetical protein
MSAVILTDRPSTVRWLSLAESARRARCHPTVIQRLALRGVIAHRTHRGRVYFAESDVDRQVVAG